jgi:retron-type reverse transcriptase
MLLHGYLPDKLMETVIVPIVKDKKGDITLMDNYRPIAITSIFSKILELLILNKHCNLLGTSDNQFGFKQKHSTDMCIFALQQVIDMYVALSSPVFICYLDASKAFDRINHWKLFSKLIHRGLPKATVRLIVYWYTSQSFIIQWGNCFSEGFTVTNGVRQGGVLSPIFFNLYVDDLSLALTKTKTGCNLNNVYFTKIMINLATK